MSDQAGQDGFLDRAAFLLANNTFRRQRVDLPMLGPKAHIYVRQISGQERDSYERATYEESKKDERNVRARFVKLVACDERGNPLFNHEYDAQVLGTTCAHALDVIVDAGYELNGMNTTAVEAAKKNSNPTPTDASSSGSPGTSSDPSPSS